MLAANRDEFFARPAAPAAFWQDHGEILAGRDLLQGGTWLGLTRSGRLAAVTNFRDGRRARAGRALARLAGARLPAVGAGTVPLPGAGPRSVRTSTTASISSPVRSAACSTTPTAARKSPPCPTGVHGLSNHLLNTAWPKVERARQGVGALADSPADTLPEALFALLAERTPAPDDALPDTGIGLEWERLLSTAFIRSSDYGTRCSTVLLVDRAGRARFEERSFGSDGTVLAHRRYDLQLHEAAETGPG